MFSQSPLTVHATHVEINDERAATQIRIIVEVFDNLNSVNLVDGKYLSKTSSAINAFNTVLEVVTPPPSAYQATLTSFIDSNFMSGPAQCDCRHATGDDLPGGKKTEEGRGWGANSFVNAEFKLSIGGKHLRD